ncbi:MAG TPA: alpha/beta hydrolase [Gaiellaceae bacterium]
MSSASSPEGRGSVSGVPQLPAGFADTFASRYVDAGDVRLHAVVGGEGPPLLLIHGWPQSWYAWRMLMPALAEDFEVIAVDQRGIGLSGKPANGYDTATLAADMVALMETLGHQRFAVYGTDTGMTIAYALAADHPDRVERLVVSEAPLPGISPSPPLFLPPPLNARLWHLAFNQLPKINEQLVRGGEEIFFGAELDASAGTHKLPDYAVSYYIETLASDPDALRGSFELYREFPSMIAQNEQRKARRLTIPVLAIGGAESSGAGVEATMKLVADDVHGVVLPDCGHWVAEQAPEALLAALTDFLVPYREGVAAAAPAGAAH